MRSILPGSGVGGAFSADPGYHLHQLRIRNHHLAAAGRSHSLFHRKQLHRSGSHGLGGGNFTLSSPGFTSSAEITDGVGTGSQALSINATSATFVQFGRAPSLVGGARGNDSNCRRPRDQGHHHVHRNRCAGFAFSTSATADNTVTGTVTTFGAFVASGGLVKIGNGTSGWVTAQAVSLDTTTVGLGNDVLSLGTVTVAGPVTTMVGSLSPAEPSLSSTIRTVRSPPPAAASRSTTRAPRSHWRARHYQWRGVHH